MKGFANPRKKIFKLLLAKAYLDKGWGLTSYFKYAVALFAIRIPRVEWGILVGIIYVIICYLIGRLWYKHKFIEIENEIGNIFNPFQREVRKHIKKRNI